MSDLIHLQNNISYGLGIGATLEKISNHPYMQDSKRVYDKLLDFSGEAKDRSQKFINDHQAIKRKRDFPKSSCQFNLSEPDINAPRHPSY